MSLLSLQLFGCNKTSGLQQSIEFDLSNSASAAEFSFITDGMPLVAPLEYDQANILYPGNDYDEALILHYEAEEVFVNFLVGDIESRNKANSSEQVDFQEYKITHTATAPQPVYALTTGYLYYLTAGQSVSDLFGGSVVGSNETALVLKPLPTVYTEWQSSHPGTLLLLDQCVYLNAEVVSETCFSDTDLSEACLKNLVRKGTSRKHYEQIYREYNSDGLPPEDWEAAYIELFKEHPEIPIVVAGGTQIGWTKSAGETDTTQSLTMFFSFGGLWDLHHSAILPFFTYYKRRNQLGGHPLIAKLLNQSVSAGTVDVIVTEAMAGARSKARLITEFQGMQASGLRTHHPLALDPDQHPHRLVVPRFRTEADTEIQNITFRSDHWLVYLRVHNPLELEISIEGDIPPEVTVSPLQFHNSLQVVEVNITGDLPSTVREATMKIMAQDSLGNASEATQIILTFMDFHVVPIRFYKLINLNYVTDMDEPKLREVIAYANEILGRQTNVYIQPIEEEGSILFPFAYTDGDLGDPIVEHDFGGSNGAEDIWQQMEVSSDQLQAKVLFVWNQEAGESLGATYRPGGLPILSGKLWAMMMIDTQPEGTFVPSVAYLAKVLVHELGHWFSKTFIGWKNGLPECTNGDEHFRHDACTTGHWKLKGNIMTKEKDDLWITYEQSSVYNDFASGVIV
jgi:hypothetical protein